MNYDPQFQWNHYQMDAVIDSTHMSCKPTCTHTHIPTHTHRHTHTPTLVSIPLWYMGGIGCQFPAEKKKLNIKIPSRQETIPCLSECVNVCTCVCAHVCVCVSGQKKKKALCEHGSDVFSMKSSTQRDVTHASQVWPQRSDPSRVQL